MAKQTKPRAPKAPASVEKLVDRALRLAATKPDAKWMGATAATLFSSKEANTEAAVKSCLDPTRPLLKQSGTGGTLTLAGFGQVADALDEGELRAAFEHAAGGVPEEEVGALAQVVATRMPLAERAAFIQKAISRTPLAAAELTPLLADVVAAAKAESDAQVAATAKRKQAHDAAMQALDRAKQLLAESLQNERDAIRRQWEALGGEADELPEPEPRPKPQPTPTGTAPEPRTDEEKDFRRYTADRLAAAWRDAWDDKKDEGRDYLETAIWNIRGMKMIGETGAKAAFDGRLHECGAPTSIGGPVKVVRPGWLLKVDDEDYVALKAAVEKA